MAEMTDTIRPVLKSGLLFGTAVGIARTIVTVDLEDVRTVATTYGDVPFLTMLDTGKRDWAIVNEIIESVRTTFQNTTAFKSRQSIYDRIASASSFIVSGNQIIVDGKTYRTHDPTLYYAYWILHHPVDTSFEDGTPEEVLYALNERDIGIDAFLNAVDDLMRVSIVQSA